MSTDTPPTTTSDSPTDATTDDPDYPLENPDVGIVYRIQGPFGYCTSCGGLTWKPYRCNAIVDHTSEGDPIECGRDLASTTISTAGNDGFRG